MKRTKQHHRKHGLAWDATAGAIRALIDLSGESYVAYRQMRARVRAEHASHDGRNCAPPKVEIKRVGTASIRYLDGPAADAVLALVSLGYRKSVAESAIRIAGKKLFGRLPRLS